MLLSMGVIVQRLISGLTALLFMTSAHCVCGNAVDPPRASGCHERTASSPPLPPCHVRHKHSPLEGNKAPPCQRDESGKHSSNCNCCSPSLTSESLASIDLARLAGSGFFQAVLETNSLIPFGLDGFQSNCFFAELPSPLD